MNDQITITESVSSEGNLLYVQSAMSEFCECAGCTTRLKRVNDRAVLTVTFSDCYREIIRTEIADKIAEIIAIKYKYDFFKQEISVSGLKSVEKEILLTSLIAADLEDDKKYSYSHLMTFNDFAIDGVYNFRLKPLKKKWQDVTTYIPNCFLEEQLKEFIKFLLENKSKRVYVDGGRVYDSHFRRLKRSSLLGGEQVQIVREVLLSNCGVIELCGEIPKDDEKYLKEYYTDKIIFSISSQTNPKYLH
ncbi:MAG: hypothetical protein IJC07_00935 [Clostridia bacterium]|nr:hypothetical protein [Clostridia bacterium]